VGSGTPEEMATKARGGEVVHISIRGPLQQVREKLKALDKVKAVETPRNSDGDLNHFEIISPPGADISEQLFFLVTQNGWSLTELYKDTANLEDIFLQLTTGEA